MAGAAPPSCVGGPRERAGCSRERAGCSASAAKEAASATLKSSSEGWSASCSTKRSPLRLPRWSLVGELLGDTELVVALVGELLDETEPVALATVVAGRRGASLLRRRAERESGLLERGGCSSGRRRGLVVFEPVEAGCSSEGLGGARRSRLLFEPVEVLGGRLVGELRRSDSDSARRSPRRKAGRGATAILGGRLVGERLRSSR